MPTVGDLCTRHRPLAPTDTVGRAAEAFRCTSATSIPIARELRLLGELRAVDLAAFLASGPPEQLARLEVSQLTLEEVLLVPQHMEAREALAMFRDEKRDNASVVDDLGQYIGHITVGQLMSVVCQRVRPRLVGGMATPFGVYLTNGLVRGGVGDAALASTGAYLATISLLATALAVGVMALFAPGGWGDGLPFLPGFLTWVADRLVEINVQPEELLTVTVFAVFFRASRVSGFHAAEHQVVHTIEAAEDLQPANVRAKPRVHPRCGTNLVAGVLVLSFFWNMRSDLGPELLVPALLLTALTWRRIGGWLQQHVTTRPATEAQIASGIRAGEELMARHQSNLWQEPTRFRRIWNIGLLQVLFGYLIVFGLYFLLGLVVELPEGMSF